jgi:hypothetical protein
MQSPSSFGASELSHDQLDMVIGGTGSPFAVNGLETLGLRNFSNFFGADPIASMGGGLFGHNGGNIVAAGGGNIVAAGGGNIVAAGGGN